MSRPSTPWTRPIRGISWFRMRLSWWVCPRARTLRSFLILILSSRYSLRVRGIWSFCRLIHLPMSRERGSCRISARWERSRTIGLMVSGWSTPIVRSPGKKLSSTCSHLTWSDRTSYPIKSSTRRVSTPIRTHTCNRMTTRKRSRQLLWTISAPRS